MNFLSGKSGAGNSSGIADRRRSQAEKARFRRTLWLGSVLVTLNGAIHGLIVLLIQTI